MAPTPTSSQKFPLGNVLIIGGCGFLGHHIVAHILESYRASISVVDLRTTRNRRPESDGVAYYDGDITSLSSLLPIFENVEPDVVIHTASPVAVGGASGPEARALYRKVNVEGTKCVIEACQKSGVKVLVYTSSASVVSDNQNDLINADERWPVIPASAQTEPYTLTKAEAEAHVLAANRSQTYPRLLTCAIRPSGIFGPNDSQAIPGFMQAYRRGQTGFQLGTNDNIFEFTYVTNVAHAHLLAARALLYTASLGNCDATKTSLPSADERVDGEAFFITNDSPIYFWDFARAVWRAAGNDKGTDHVWTINRGLGMMVGGIMEFFASLTGKTAKLTQLHVKMSCMTRYYNITKAKQRLGYAPIVSLEEGIKQSVDSWLAEEAAAEEKKQ